MRNRSLRSMLLVAAASAPLTAQALLPVPPGLMPQTWIATAMFPPHDEGVSNPLPLGFDFTMPDGVVVNAIRATTNGRISAAVGGLLASNFTETIGTLLSDPSTLAPFWDDLENSSLFFDTQSVPGAAILTWQDATEFNDTQQFTLQLQVYADDSFVFVWDNRARLLDGDALIGFSSGNGAPTPGELDYTDLFLAGSLPCGMTAFEHFVPLNSDFYDLSEAPLPTTGLVFTPATNGYVITGMVPPPDGTVTLGRQGCTANLLPRALTFTPTMPGYVVTEGGSFDDQFAGGVSLPLIDDSLSMPVPISFGFRFPGGVVAQSIIVDSNGRILEPAAAIASVELSDPSPSPAELLADPVAQVCPLWTDLMPGAAGGGGGQVLVNDDGTATSVSITWFEVPEFPTSPTNTFQARLLADGRIEFHYRVLTLGDDDLLIGLSPGGGVSDPGETDLSSTPLNAQTEVVYEDFDFSEPFDFDDKANDSVTIVALSAPEIGQPFVVDVQDTTGAAFSAVYFFGLPSGLLAPPLGLGFLSPDLASCRVLTDILTPGAILSQVIGTPGTPTVVLAIPPQPSLIGVEGLVVSALVINPTLDLTVFPTDELVIFVGG